jgi:hypothetical protein
MSIRSLTATCTLAVVALAAHPAAGAAPTAIELPPDGAQLKASSLPGYAKAQASCVACHSAEYMRYQPPTAPRTYWEAMVKRMKLVFKAPIADDDMPEIIDYLARTYGAEQAR